LPSAELLPQDEGQRAAFVRAGLERYLLGLLHPKILGVGADAVEDKVLTAQIGTLSYVRRLSNAPRA